MRQRQLHELRRILSRWGYVVLKVPEGFQVTNDSLSPHNTVSHTYNSLEELQKYLFVYQEN